VRPLCHDILLHGYCPSLRFHNGSRIIQEQGSVHHSTTSKMLWYHSMFPRRCYGTPSHMSWYLTHVIDTCSQHGFTCDLDSSMVNCYWLTLISRCTTNDLREVVVAFRGAARVCSRPSVIPVIHGPAIWCHHWVRMYRTCVCWRHTSLCHYASWGPFWCSGSSASCIIRVRDWMARNRLKLNEDNTRVIWLGTRQQLDKVMVQTLVMCNAMLPFSSVVNDLGVLLDSELTMAN